MMDFSHALNFTVKVRKIKNALILRSLIIHVAFVKYFTYMINRNVLSDTAQWIMQTYIAPFILRVYNDLQNHYMEMGQV